MGDSRMMLADPVLQDCCVLFSPMMNRVTIGFMVQGDRHIRAADDSNDWKCLRRLRRVSVVFLFTTQSGQPLKDIHRGDEIGGQASRHVLLIRATKADGD
jgi:hypothetical protein